MRYTITLQTVTTLLIQIGIPLCFDSPLYDFDIQLLLAWPLLHTPEMDGRKEGKEAKAFAIDTINPSKKALEEWSEWLSRDFRE